MTPKVTVLLAVKDGEPYVRGAVESVLAQTFADFELLVVDDGSTDRTGEIVESFGDARVRLLRNDRNLGQVPSLNRGLHEARGEYVARLDADDKCRPTRLERQAAVLDAEPSVGLVGAWMEAVGERGEHLGWLRKSLVDYVDFVYHTLIMRVYVSHPAAMYRREPVLALGGYDEATGPSEDKDLWRKLALERWEARIVEEVLVSYRLHENQLSQVRAADQRDVDGRSQDRFLAELAPHAPVRAVRLVLAGDDAFWDERHDARETLRDLDAVLAGARTRLRLDDDEARRLGQLVAARLAAVARTRPWSTAARAIAAAAVRRLPPERRRAAVAAHAAALALAPARGAIRGTLRRGARAAPRLRAPAKRSRLARRLYGKLVGSE